MATKKQALIIGLGQFGTALARTLAKRGVEVIAVDSKYELVQAIADDVDEALCFDATDEQALAGVAPAQRDLCVSAIGPEARDASIIVTALLRQLGAPTAWEGDASPADVLAPLVRAAAEVARRIAMAEPSDDGAPAELSMESSKRKARPKASKASEARPKASKASPTTSKARPKASKASKATRKGR